ncbi:MAG: YjcQ family protein [Clostridiales bacterium]|nr:YjcQ family protein [Clostridiales bacterium]
MADNDYFKVVYRILDTLYAYMQEGLPVNPDAISAEALNIPEGYRREVVANLLEDGLVRGGEAKRYLRQDMPLVNADSLRITTKGVEFLKENSNMRKVYNFLHGVKEIVPGI